MAIQKRCVGSKVCVLQFSIFSCAHLGSSTRDLSKRPRWSTYVESEGIGVKSLCLEGLVDYFFAHHAVKWRPCFSTLRPIDIMTQVFYGGTFFGAQHILDPANNSTWA